MPCRSLRRESNCIAWRGNWYEFQIFNEKRYLIGCKLFFMKKKKKSAVDVNFIKTINSTFAACGSGLSTLLRPRVKPLMPVVSTFHDTGGTTRPPYFSRGVMMEKATRLWPRLPLVPTKIFPSGAPSRQAYSDKFTFFLYLNIKYIIYFYFFFTCSHKRRKGDLN